MYSEILSRRMLFLLLPYIYWVCALCTSSGEMFHLLPPPPPVLCVVHSVLSGEENPWNFEEKYQKDYLLQLLCSRGCCCCCYSDEGRELSPCVSVGCNSSLRKNIRFMWIALALRVIIARPVSWVPLFLWVEWVVIKIRITMNSKMPQLLAVLFHWHLIPNEMHIQTGLKYA